MSDGYNGWHNYETWLFNLWFTNEQYTAEEVTRVVSEIRDAVVEPDPLDFDDLSGLAEALESYEEEKAEILGNAESALKDWVEEYLYDALDNAKLGGTIFSDLLRNAIYEVDFREWAENLLEQ